MPTTSASKQTPTTPADGTPRLLLIDGHSVAYRAFFALPVENFATQTGQHTNAVFGFTSMLINVLRDEQPTHVGVAFDVSRTTFRTQAYADYKANRSASPAEFSGQVGLIKEVLDALNIAYLERDGYEADDVIATLVAGAEADDCNDVLICTGDRDTFQLVDESVTVLYPRKGVSDLVRMTPQAIEEKYQVTPGRYPELAALVGESSDNLPGIPGVGPKTAAKWLGTYDGLDNLLDRAGEVKGKAGDALRERIPDVRLNRQLNALVCDLDLPLGLADLTRRDWNREAVHQLFDQLEFRVLRDRLMEALPVHDAEPEGGFDVAGAVLEPGQLPDWLAANASGHSRTGLDPIGQWAAGSGDITALSLSSGDGAAVHVLTADATPADEQALADWLADPHRPKAMHSAKGPLLAIWARGWDLAGLTSDTQLAGYLVRPDQRSYDLADLAARYLKRELVSSSPESADNDGNQPELGFDDGQLAESIEPSMVRARAVVDLADALDQEIDEHGGSRLLHEVELPLQRTLALMERTGIAVDVDHLQILESEFGGAVDAAAADAFEVLGKEINLGSPKQLQTVLFDELGMPKTRRTRTGYTTDADALQQLYVKTEHPFLAHLLTHRDAIRLKQTVEGLLKAVADDGRIHTTYVQTIAATGRLSSTDPNLQNIPIRTDAGRRIRDAFVVGAGYETLLSADYSQIEMRIMADQSADAGLIEAFQSGADFHTITASRVFGVGADDIQPGQRAKIKAMNYGLAYGLSAYGLSQQLGIEVADARGLMDEYFERFGGVRDYLQSLVEDARRTSFTQTLLGRRRYLPDLTSDNRQRRQMAERMALNAPIQGSAADIIKIAMLDVERGLAEAGLQSRMLLQVHDELVFEVAAGERDRLEEMVRDKMGNAVKLSVPLDVSIGVGRSWHDAAH